MLGWLFRCACTHTGEENIAKPGALVAQRRYFWRVVAQMPDGSERAGPLWSFTASTRPTCVGLPAAAMTAAMAVGDSHASPPAAPTPASCLAALESCCGAQGEHKHGGDVKGLGDLCMSHMRRHNATLTDPEAGAYPERLT